VKPAVSGAASGVVIGIAAVILLQQLGEISFSDIVTGLVYLLVAAIAGGVVFGVGGWLLNRSAVMRAQKILANEGVPTEGSAAPTAPSKTPDDPSAKPDPASGAPKSP
jgi:hypothetical protein